MTKYFFLNDYFVLFSINLWDLIMRIVYLRSFNFDLCLSAVRAISDCVSSYGSSDFTQTVFLVEQIDWTSDDERMCNFACQQS